jgi:hypothetical protein
VCHYHDERGFPNLEEVLEEPPANFSGLEAKMEELRAGWITGQGLLIMVATNLVQVTHIHYESGEYFITHHPRIN